jgi:tetratricopeptide (TPR) repeat protein
MLAAPRTGFPPSVRAAYVRDVEGTAALHALPPVTPAFVGARVPDGRAEAAAAVARIESLVAEHRYLDAIDAIADVLVPAVSAPDLALRVLFAESWAQMYLGRLDAAAAALERARALAEGRAFTDLDRAEALFRLGACRHKLGRTTNAISLFTSAIALTERGGGRRALEVRAQALEWRSRCYQVQREWEAAQADAERSLELAEDVRDDRVAAHALMQCSLIAERRGDALTARLYAERARALAADVGDRQAEARLLNNLGGLSLLLGEPEKAVTYLKESFALALELGADADAAQAVSSLAQVHLRCGAPQLAEEQARYALSILADRDDFLDERGNAHLVLGRALHGQERGEEALTELAAAEWLFERHGSASYLAAAWTAQADVYRQAGDTEAALDLYRRAVDALQDFRF